MSGADSRAAHPTLVDALAAAQGEIRAADLDRVNPAFKSRYATLASIMDAVRGPLARHGLAITHTLGSQPGGVVVGTAILYGAERLGTEILMPLPGNATPQAVGSAITYGRRYGVSALLAVVADDDDDGEAASAPSREWGRGPSRAAELATAAVRPQDRRVPPDDAPPPLPRREPEPRQLAPEAPRLAPHQAEVWTRWVALGRSRQDLVDLLGRQEGVEGLSDLDAAAARRVLDALPPAPTEAPKAGVRRGGAR